MPLVPFWLGRCSLLATSVPFCYKERSPFQEPKKGVLAKGVSAESSVTPKETKSIQGYWAQQYIWHSERHSQERCTFCKNPLLKNPLLLVPDHCFVVQTAITVDLCLVRRAQKGVGRQRELVCKTPCYVRVSDPFLPFCSCLSLSLWTRGHNSGDSLWCSFGPVRRHPPRTNTLREAQMWMGHLQISRSQESRNCSGELQGSLPDSDNELIFCRFLVMKW